MSTKETELTPGTKDLATGEIAPPLPHDEYTEAWKANAAAEERERARNPRGRARTPAPVEVVGGAAQKSRDAKK
jgi:hypothetical protein